MEGRGADYQEVMAKLSMKSQIVIDSVGLVWVGKPPSVREAIAQAGVEGEDAHLVATAIRSAHRYYNEAIAKE